MKIKWMKFIRGSFKMEFKYIMDTTAKSYTVVFCRNRGAPAATMDRLLTFQPQPLYAGGLPIKGKKT